MSITTDIDRAIVESDMLRNMIAVLDMVQSAAAPAWCNIDDCEWCDVHRYDDEMTLWSNGHESTYYNRCSQEWIVMQSLRYVLPFESIAFSSSQIAHRNIGRNVAEFPDLYGDWLYVEIDEALQRCNELNEQIEEYEERLMTVEIDEDRREMAEAMAELESDPDYIAYRNGEDIFDEDAWEAENARRNEFETEMGFDQ